MARNDAVWGIDIGQYSLKALRCVPGERPGQIVADAFDFITYPKILSQPGANPEELIQEALSQFLSRNSVRGDRVAVSVSGQNGLARFIKLPPVESKKIPDIVRYEARQQIPFDLDDVVWDYQQMGGSAEEEGFVLETEIGLFAMKRDQVFRALQPFTTAGIEVDIVQLTPLALYNYVLSDQLTDLPPIEEYDPDNPPPSQVVMSLGTDSTDLVITNGFRVWQRSIPIGGNHFTKALTKELKLTFAKAEHLKCNVTAAKDPKALFQAMRTVFSDLLTEIQRSIGYFNSIDRNATIKQVLALGGTMKMPGLRRYLSQSLGLDVVRVDRFRNMDCSKVIGVPAFKENLVSYAICYGLAVQGIETGRGVLKTNLLPREIVKERFIRSKKPWAVAAAALLLLGFTISYAGASIALSGVQDPQFKTASQKCNSVAGRSQQLKTEDQQAKIAFEEVDKIGQHLIGNVENRIIWLELLRAVNECLPQEQAAGTAEKPKLQTAEQRRKDIMQRRELHVTSFECQLLKSPDSWIQEVVKNGWYQPTEEEIAAGMGGEMGVDGGMGMDAGMGMDGGMAMGMDSGMAMGGGMGMDGEMGVDGGQKDVWLIQLTGFHYHNSEEATLDQGAQFVRDTLIKNLQDMEIYLPTGDKQKTEGGEQKMELVTMKELGVSYPSLINPGNVKEVQIVDRDADAEAETEDVAFGRAQGGGMGGMAGGMGGGLGGGMMDLSGKKMLTLRRFDFVVQFCWRPTPPTIRQKKAKQQQEQGEAGQLDNGLPGANNF